jgi:type VII secretion-associated serine protease mycosin
VLAAACALSAGGLLATALAGLPPPPAELAMVRPAEMTVLQQVNVPRAWDVTKGRGVTVAVLDSGVDTTAPDLSGQVTVGPDYVAGVDPPGYRPPLNHGTYIASLIAGHGQGPGDAQGVVGVAPQAKVLSVRVIPDDTEPGVDAYNTRPAYADAIGKGIYYAVRHHASVINMSLGSSQPTAYLRTAVAYALTRKVVVVASAGNNGAFHNFAPYIYPASYPGVIAVAAVNVSGARADFSEQNASVVVSAPGVAVLGAGPGGEYIDADGTSPAAALVSGVAALIRSRYPALSPVLVEQALIDSATRRPPGGYSVEVGFGEVDAAAALTAAGTLAAQSRSRGLPPGTAVAVPDTTGPDTTGPDTTGPDTTRPGGTAPRRLPPIVVVHRDQRAITAYAVAATGAAVLAAICLAALIVLARRPRRPAAGMKMTLFPPPAGPPGDDLIG